MQSVNERLAALPDLLGYDSPAALAKAAGIDPNTLRKAMQGPSKPSFDTLEAITTRWPKLSAVWLLSGKGEPLLKAGYSTVEEPAIPLELPATQAAPTSMLPMMKNRLPLSQREPLLPEQVRSTIDFPAKLIAVLEKSNTEKDALIEELRQTVADLRADKAELRKKPEGNRLAATAPSTSLTIHRFGSESTRRLRAQRRQFRQEWRAQQERKRVGFTPMQIVREAA